jgi:hypothetical protein
MSSLTRLGKKRINLCFIGDFLKQILLYSQETGIELKRSSEHGLEVIVQFPGLHFLFSSCPDTGTEIF